MDRSRKEQKIHGSVDFPMAVYFLERDKSSYTKLFCHWHEEFECILVTGGGGIFQIGSHSFKVLEGEAVLACPGELHSAVALEDLPCRYVSIVFHPSLFSAGLEDRIPLKYVDPLLQGEFTVPHHITGRTADGKQLIEALYEIRSLFLEKKTGYELLAKADIYRIWYLLYSNGEKSVESIHKRRGEKEKKAKEILQYIHEKYREDITLEQLAKMTHMSKGQFCRFFHAMVRMPAIQYVNYYRVGQSAKLLDETQWKISDVASYVGFNNIGYYNRVFRRYMGCSPSQYRKRKRIL